MCDDALHCGGMIGYAATSTVQRGPGDSLRAALPRPTPAFEDGFPRASQFRDNSAMCLAGHPETIMRHATLVSTAIIAAILSFPALSFAQGQLPRPGKDAP